MCLFTPYWGLIPLGYWVRFYEGGRAYWNDLGGALASEVFWILFALLVYPPASERWVAIAVCLATCLLEFLQLWHPPFLEAMHATLPSRLVLGNTFMWRGSGQEIPRAAEAAPVWDQE